MSIEQRILNHIESKRDGIISFMQRLIQTRSVTGEEAEIGALMEKECARDGLKVDLVEPLTGRISIVAKHTGTGGKVRLGGISKRGDRYLRQLLIHGARAVVRQVGEKQDPLSCWIRRLVARRGMNKAIVALANKNARMAFAIIYNDQTYDDTKMCEAV